MAKVLMAERVYKEEMGFVVKRRRWKENKITWNVWNERMWKWVNEYFEILGKESGLGF